VEGIVSEHEVVTAPELAPPVGFAHAVIPAGSELVFLGGQTALNATNEIVGRTVVEQFDQAAHNLVCAMEAAGCSGTDLISLQIFCTDIAEYRASLAELAPVWRRHFGRRYPAMGLFGVTRLFDDEAKVELMGVAARRPGSE
jgi:enamine deaminase RidA (YjgF/YER057c/UK114 family)